MLNVVVITTLYPFPSFYLSIFLFPFLLCPRGKRRAFWSTYICTQVASGKDKKPPHIFPLQRTFAKKQEREDKEWERVKAWVKWKTIPLNVLLKLLGLQWVTKGKITLVVCNMSRKGLYCLLVGISTTLTLDPCGDLTCKVARCSTRQVTTTQRVNWSSGS